MSPNGVESVVLGNGRLPVNFRYALVATEAARRCNMSRRANSRHRSVSLFAVVAGLPKVTRLANAQRPATGATFAATMAIMDTRYLNNAIASSASTPPVIEIGANGALAATSALDSMI
jgi:hypothetical protein